MEDEAWICRSTRTIAKHRGVTEILAIALCGAVVGAPTQTNQSRTCAHVAQQWLYDSGDQYATANHA